MYVDGISMGVAGGGGGRGGGAAIQGTRVQGVRDWAAQ